MSDQSFETTIGLETHVQLKTRSKMFCACPNAYGGPENSRTCPICLGLPGALPSPNREAFCLGLRVGLALNCRINRVVRFDRKQYFYADLPKGYQITQLDHPSHVDGFLELRTVRTSESSALRVPILRAHLEEDAAKSRRNEDGSLDVDFNRSGIPLLEIVTAPAISSANEASEYLRTLRALVRRVGAGDCDMEKGSLRCDVNISMKPLGSNLLGRRVEIKNLNSFRAVERAIEYEERRQRSLLRAGSDVGEFETRLWDDLRGETRVMRSKEDTADYRYFPDPDLPTIRVSDAVIDRVRAELPELPAAMFRRFQDQLGLSDYDADLMSRESETAAFFEALLREGVAAKTAANWITTKVMESVNRHQSSLDNLAVSPTRLAALIQLEKSGSLTRSGAARVFELMLECSDDPKHLAETHQLLRVADAAALQDWVERALADDPKSARDIREGNRKAVDAILGRVMRESGGTADPHLARKLIESQLPKS